MNMTQVWCETALYVSR